jgi:hypothetical protein
MLAVMGCGVLGSLTGRKVLAWFQVRIEWIISSVGLWCGGVWDLMKLVICNVLYSSWWISRILQTFVVMFQ